MAIFEFTELTYVEAVWFVGDGQRRDWMAVMFRDAPDQPFRAKYRFRYYNSADPDDPDDEKSVYAIELKHDTPESRAELVRALDYIASMTAEEYGPNVKVIRGDIRGGLDEFSAWMHQQPFAHVKVAAAESTETH